MFFDVKKFAISAFQRANGDGVDYRSINIFETELGGLTDVTVKSA